MIIWKWTSKVCIKMVPKIVMILTRRSQPTKKPTKITIIWRRLITSMTSRELRIRRIRCQLPTQIYIFILTPKVAAKKEWDSTDITRKKTSLCRLTRLGRFRHGVANLANCTRWAVQIHNWLEGRITRKIAKNGQVCDTEEKEVEKVVQILRLAQKFCLQKRREKDLAVRL